MIVADGLAGDGACFEQTWVLKDGHPSSSYVSAVGFYGDRVRLGHGSKGGWDIFGIERRVTRAQSNVLYELDGRPALQPYKEYLGERTAGLLATALFPEVGGTRVRLLLRKSSSTVIPIGVKVGESVMTYRTRLCRLTS